MRLGLYAYVLAVVSVAAQTAGLPDVASRRDATNLRWLGGPQVAGRVGGVPSGAASFRVYEKGMLVGSVETSVERTNDGWRLRSSSRIAGAVPVTIPNLDVYYDPSWSGRFMTLEMKAPDDAIVHVAVVGDTTRTDIVRATEVRFRSSSVSPDTIFLPDRAYAAYEALAARLTSAVPGLDLPIFIPPLGETRTRVDAVTSEQMKTAQGMTTARRYRMTELRQRPTPVEIWVADGRLLRLDVPGAALSLVRSDLLP